MRKSWAIAVMAISTLVSPLDSARARPAWRMPVGTCWVTRVKVVETRLEGVAGSGSAIEYVDGNVQTSYEAVRGIDHSRKGDRVRLCIAELPRDCPPGDHRGVVFRAVNLRTREHWKEQDYEHGCGGA